MADGPCPSAAERSGRGENMIEGEAAGWAAVERGNRPACLLGCCCADASHARARKKKLGSTVPDFYFFKQLLLREVTYSLINPKKKNTRTHSKTLLLLYKTVNIFTTHIKLWKIILCKTST